MSKLQAPRGCPDWLPKDCKLADSILEKAQKCAEIYGFEPYKTPIFEHSEVFTKTLGDSSDIITKEMYSLKSKSDETFVLRPEATAPLVRLFISEKLQRSAPLKMFTYGPMFRYERPQKGRQRQFHQIGVEHIGAAKNLFNHFEILSMGWSFVNSLELSSSLKVKVNGIGAHDERINFKKSLISYLTPLKTKLSEDSQKRLEQNPLRILDSKSEQDKELLKEAPLLKDFINKESQQDLNSLIQLCESENITIEEDPMLVRGLDYYNDLVFEIISDENLGAQNTVLAGGRYDELVASMGGGSHPAIGWGAGLERLMLLSTLKPQTMNLTGLVLQQNDFKLLSKVSHQIRNAGHALFAPTTGNFSKKLLKCEKAGCNKVVIIGEDEIKNNLWTIKDFESGDQKSLNPEEALKKL
jgi:histidyl-tRNA synthetase